MSDNLGGLGAAAKELTIIGQAFHPNGGPWGQQGTINMPFGFAGEMEDENELVYLRARYYSHDMGSFLSQDPTEGRAVDPMSLIAMPMRTAIR